MGTSKSKKGLGTKGASFTPAGQVVSHCLVMNPEITDDQYRRLRQTKGGPDVGKVSAQVNLIAVIGGLARIKGRTALQEEAAARYRRLWDRAQAGGIRAFDYAQVRVDTSGSGAGEVAEFGEAARRKYATASRFLGMTRSSLVERVVVHDQSLRAIAGSGGRVQMRIRTELLAALDELAVHFQLAPREKG